MCDIKNILFPIELPSGNENAFEYAVELAAHGGGTITLFHVYPIFEDYGEDSDGIPTMDIEAQETVCIDKMKYFVTEYFKNSPISRPDNVTIKYVVVPDNFINQTIIYCRDNQVNLVVLGMNKRHRFAEMLFGSNTQGILDNVEVPVLFVPREASYAGFKRIVYASDQEDGNITALANLKAYAERCKQIKIKLLYLQGEMLEENEIQDSDWFAFAKANPKITWQVLSQDDEVDLLEEYLEENHEQVDVLALLHKKAGMFEGFFRRNLAKEMSFNRTTPILVFQSEEGRLKEYLDEESSLRIFMT